MKRILIVLGHNRFTGVNTWAYTLGDFLIRRGHKVDFEIKKDYEFVDNFDGVIPTFQKLKSTIYIKTLPDYNSYDYSIINYNTHQKYIDKNKIIFVSHGSMYEPYVPFGKVHAHVAVSARTQEIVGGDVVIHNGIDLEKFRPTTFPKTPPRKALNIFRGIPNYSLYRACENLGIELTHISQEDDVMTSIKENDIIVGYGRAAYEGMASGKPVLIHGVSGHDGWIKTANFETLFIRNCSGWTNKLKLSIQELQEVLGQYDPNDGIANRKLAIKYLSAETMATKFEELFK
jgi:glycosyltransferase involved in cell wall biosynthesis